MGKKELEKEKERNVYIRSRQSEKRAEANKRDQFDAEWRCAVCSVKTSQERKKACLPSAYQVCIPLRIWKPYLHGLAMN